MSIEQATQTMHISQKMHKLCMQKTKALYATFSRPYSKEIQDIQQSGGIQDYEANRDATSIAPIAFKNMHKLTSDVTEENRSELLNQEIMPTLSSDKSTTSKVYLIDGKAVGFINYYIGYKYQPWYYTCIPYSFGPSANINWLAIDDEYQGKGIGTALLNYALEDCQNQSANYITLSTTGFESYKTQRSLYSYYLKFGFKCIGEGRYRGVAFYKKALKPHPAIMLSKAALDWLYKSRE